MKREKKSIFYKVLLAILLVLLLVFCYIRFGLLRPWLTRFEAAQPKHTSQEIFQTLFSPADWGRVYDEANLDGTVYQGREGFIQSMEELTAGQELTLVETSAGLSGDRRYIVKAGSDSVAAFTLVNKGQDGETAWQLDSVEMLLGQTGTVTVRAADGCRVLVNGAELGEDCQVQRIQTAAEHYLPQGVSGPRTTVWQTQVSTIRQAEVTVLDETGASLPLTYDANTNCFTAQVPQDQPSEEERSMLLGAAKSYAKFMIRQSTTAQLQKYFDSQSQIYQTIRSSEIWIKNTSGHSFENESISEYCRYSPDLFSARVTMDMKVRRGNGTLKPYTVDSTFFFHKTGGGWRAFEMTNMDVQEEIVHTRLLFMNGQEALGQVFVSSSDRSFTPPAVTAPQGQRFAGWAVRESSGNSVTMTVRFQPGEDGAVTLPEGYSLEPMTLYAAFEAAK
jgi:hypothetical protein